MAGHFCVIFEDSLGFFGIFRDFLGGQLAKKSIQSLLCHFCVILVSFLGILWGFFGIHLDSLRFFEILWDSLSGQLAKKSITSFLCHFSVIFGDSLGILWDSFGFFEIL